MPWHRAPLAPVALSFALGIALAPWSSPRLAWVLWLLAMTTAAVLLALGRVHSGGTAVLLAVAATAALRAAPAPLPADAVARLSLPVATTIEGRLVTEPTRLGKERLRLVVDVERAGGEPRTGRIHLTVYGLAPSLTQGQTIAADARLQHAVGFRNPGGFDYAARLAREDVHVTATARGSAVRTLDAPPPPWHVRVKRQAGEAIERALPPASAALLEGLLLGERGQLPSEIQDGFRRAGVYHVLAVSGFNVALLAGSLFALAAFVGAGRRAGAMAAIVAVTGFAFVVGPEPSVLRAVVMAVLVLAAVLLQREAAVVNSLALAGLAILAVRPGDLRDPGFQLSFAATIGIVLAPIPRGGLAAAVGVSLAAQLAVLPITAYHFNQFSPIGLLANLGVVPLAGVATVLGLVAVTLAVISEPLAGVFFDALWPALLAMRGVVAVAAAVPGALVRTPAPSAAALGCYAAALGLALVWWRARPSPRLAAAAGAMGVVALVLAAWPVIRPADGWLRVTVLDVGQGDAIVVELPDRRALLVDAGPGGPMRLDAGERVVAPFLWNSGIFRLAATLVTHADADHAGGMAAIARLFPIDERWDGGSPGIQRFLAGVRVTTLGERGISAKANDAAAVLRLEYGLASILLASDIAASAERRLLAAGVPLAATVLKVPHHGSRGSSSAEFLRAVAPAVAVISVGSRNSYGHPDPATLRRLAEAGATTYRTDRDGAVIVQTDGRVLNVTRWASRHSERYCLDPEAIC